MNARCAADRTISGELMRRSWTAWPRPALTSLRPSLGQAAPARTRACTSVGPRITEGSRPAPTSRGGDGAPGRAPSAWPGAPPAAQPRRHPMPVPPAPSTASPQPCPSRPRPSPARPPCALLDLGAVLTAPGYARAWTREILCEWGLPGLADDAEAMVSELVANSVNASRRIGGAAVQLILTLSGASWSSSSATSTQARPRPGTRCRRGGRTRPAARPGPEPQVRLVSAPREQPRQGRLGDPTGGPCCTWCFRPWFHPLTLRGRKRAPPCRASRWNRRTRNVRQPQQPGPANEVAKK